MARNDCGVCCLLYQGNNIDKLTWMQLTGRLLCDAYTIFEQMLTALSTIAGGTVAATQIGTPALTRIAFGAIPAAFPGVAQFNDTHNKSYLNLYNGTNKTLLFGFDGATAAETLPPSTAIVYHYGEMSPPKFEARPVYVMYDGVAPTDGEMTISAQY